MFNISVKQRILLLTLTISSASEAGIVVAVKQGGTGATTAAGARANLAVVSRAGDTMTGTLELQHATPLTLNSSGITASRLLQVDSLKNVVSSNALPSNTTGPFVLLEGDTMSGVLNVGADVKPQNVDLNIDSGKYKINGNTIISVGTGANANNTMVGVSASPNITSGTKNTSIGRNAGSPLTTQTDNVAIGYNSMISVNNSSAIQNTCIGSQSCTQITSGQRNVIIGAEAGSIGGPQTGNGNVLIGRDSRHTAVGGSSNSIGIGNGVRVTAANQAVFGSDTSSTQNVYFGSGVASTSPIAYTINGTGGSGSNVAGGNVRIAGGQGTGSAAGGSVIIQISTAGSSGSSANALHDNATFDANGLTINPKTTGAGNTGEVRFLELAAQGTNYVGFKAADTLSGNVTWVLPVTDGSSNAVLKTDGAGVLSFSRTAITWAARINGSATTPTIQAQIPESWLSTTITRNGLGDYSLTINGGFCSADPLCTISAYSAAATPVSCQIANDTPPSSTAIRTACGIDSDYIIQCTCTP